MNTPNQPTPPASRPDVVPTLKGRTDGLLAEMTEFYNQQEDTRPDEPRTGQQDIVAALHAYALDCGARSDCLGLTIRQAAAEISNLRARVCELEKQLTNPSTTS